jgi:hypothetical protein
MNMIRGRNNLKGGNDMEDTKVCRVCKVERGISEFYKHKGSRDGRKHECKLCSCQYFRERRRRTGLHYVRSREEAFVGNYISNGIKSGKIERPTTCEMCGEKDVFCEAHHPDYDKPDVVVWGSRSCHRQLHSYYREYGTENTYWYYREKDNGKG